MKYIVRTRMHRSTTMSPGADVPTESGEADTPVVADETPVGGVKTSVILKTDTEVMAEVMKALVAARGGVAAPKIVDMAPPGRGAPDRTMERVGLLNSINWIRDGEARQGRRLTIEQAVRLYWKTLPGSGPDRVWNGRKASIAGLVRAFKLARREAKDSFKWMSPEKKGE